VVTVQVGSQVSGNIKTLYADFNTKVKKGQLIALIDPAIFQARVNQATANLDSARASLLNAQAVSHKIEADIQSAKAAVANMKAEIARAKVATRDAQVKFDRRQDLFRSKLIAQEDLDTAQTTYDSAVAAGQAAEAQYNAAVSNQRSQEAQLEVSKAQIETARAQVRQAEAALAQAQLDLDHTRIVAPVEGTVISRHMDEGQTVAASLQAPTIFEIAQDLAQMQVDTNVDEADIGRVQAGQRATFTVDAFPGTVFQASVQQIRQAPINTQNVRLFPGMTANVRILTSSVTRALLAPNAAFRFRMPDAPASDSKSQKQTLHVLGKDGKVRVVRVTAGISNGSVTEIRDGGIQEGELVIVGLAGGGARTAPGAAQPRGPGGRGPAF
jgi:HlyD family secretion protein